MVIAFDEIPSSIRKPGKYLEFNYKLAVRTLPANKQKMLIIGQRTASGAVAELVPTQVFDDKQAEAYFGAGSVAHLMVLAAINANRYLDLTVVALDDAGAGVGASGKVSITGPATSSGALTVFIGAEKVTIAVAKADTATAIALAIKNQMDKQTSLPITAVINGVNAYEVDLTAKNKGEVGNEVGLGYSKTDASGVAVAITAMAGGATNPTLQSALDVVFAEKYDNVATPFNNQTDLTTLRTHLDSVSGPLEQRPGVGYYAMTGSIANATTLSALINSGRIVGPLLRYTSTQRKTISYNLAASIAAVESFEEDPARPRNTLALKDIMPPDIADRLSRTEQESLLYNGVTPLEVGSGEKVQIVRAITTYTVDAQGVDDPALLDETTIKTLDYVRHALRQRIALRFPRSKLSSKTPPRVFTELYDVLTKLEELEIVEEVAANKDGLIVERDGVDVNRLNAKIPVDVVNGLHIFAGRIDLLL